MLCPPSGRNTGFVKIYGEGRTQKWNGGAIPFRDTFQTLLVLLSLAAVEAAGFYSACACRRAAGVALARMLVRHAFVWLLFVTVLHMWNDFGFDGFFGLRRRVLRIGSDDQQDSQRSEAFFHHIYVRELLLLPERSKAGCIARASCGYP